jgi:pilus assembly protein Flp/PilA
LALPKPDALYARPAIRILPGRLSGGSLLPMLQKLWVITTDKFITKEDGVTLVEYALLIALIAIVCIVAIVLVGQDTSATLNTAATSM